MLPHGLLAVSIATTFAPELAARSPGATGPRSAARRRSALRLDRAARRCPAGVLHLRAPAADRRRAPAARRVHRRRRADNTSRALGGFALGLVGFSVYLFVLRGFYAHQDTRTPFVINVGENVLNIVLALVLVGRYGVLGLGAAFGHLLRRVARCGRCRSVATRCPGSRCGDVLQPLADGRRRRRSPARSTWLVARPSAATAGSVRRRRLIVGGLVGVAVVRRRAGRAPGARAGGACGTAPRPARRHGDPRAVGSPPCSSSCEEVVEVPHGEAAGSFNERADPKVQLEQAITEAQDQHRRLKEQAANVIANQKQAELRLNAKMAELEKLNANARQALIMAADAEKAGDADKAAQYTSAAETIANQLIQVEKDVESLKTMVLESTQASDQAKAAVAQNSRLLQEKLAEKSKLLQPARPGEDAGGDEQGDGPAQRERRRRRPTLAEVQEKIQARYAKAKATAELTETSVESRVLEIEQATANVEAQSRLQRAARRARPRRRRRPSPRPSSRRQPARPSRRTAGLTRSAPTAIRPDRAGDRQRRSSTRSSRWMTSWATPAGGRSCAGRRRARSCAGVDDTMPAGEHRAVVPC